MDSSCKDDAIATATTMRVAINALHQHKPATIVIVVSVAPLTIYYVKYGPVHFTEVAAQTELDRLRAETTSSPLVDKILNNHATITAFSSTEFSIVFKITEAHDILTSPSPAPSTTYSPFWQHREIELASTHCRIEASTTQLTYFQP